MRYFRIIDSTGSIHLGVEAQENVLASLTSVNSEVRDFRDLLRAGYISGLSVDDIARHILTTGRAETFDLATLIEWSRSGSGEARIIRPLEPEEMWAGGPGNYAMADDVVAGLNEAGKAAYISDRPPVAYKGTASRLAGPFDKIGIRADTERTVAEGELVVVIYRGRIAGYSTGNEVAGGLMRGSMWWLAPSKVFKGCASIGPCVVTPEGMPDPTNLKMELVITRDGREQSRVTNVTSHRRHPDELVKWLVAHDSPPDLVVLYTGGCVVDGQTPLQGGDVVRISMEGVGFVENTVEVV